jgi:hypothetical protein
MSEKRPLRNGKRGSNPGAPSSVDKLRTCGTPNPKLLKLLADIFDDMRKDDRKELGRAVYEQQRHDFAFHMTDWLADLEGLHKLFDQQDIVDRETARTFLIGFLYHVVPHLNAAGRLLVGEITDPFAPAAKPAIQGER